jgi:hypothetical protein
MSKSSILMNPSRGIKRGVAEFCQVTCEPGYAWDSPWSVDDPSRARPCS